MQLSGRNTTHDVLQPYHVLASDMYNSSVKVRRKTKKVVVEWGRHHVRMISWRQMDDYRIKH